MASNTGAANNKRTAVRHIRDGIKSNYKKDSKCACCGTSEDLELHHYTTVSILLKNYCRERNIPINTDDEVLEMREQFYTDNWENLVEYTVTLCNEHHKALHRIYGKEPALSSAGKQELWVKKVHGRLNGMDADSQVTGRFSQFIPQPGIEDRFSRLI